MINSLLPISSRKSIIFCVVLALFEFMTYIASDVIMPGMLTVTADMHAKESYVPWSLNAYLLGGVAFQWLLGPLSDRFGRRPLLLTGCALFSVSLCVTAWANNIHLFTVLRFIQGMGLGFVVVVSYPALQESFNESDAIRLIALIANIALLSPLLGPLIGSFLLTLMTWRTMFIVIAVLSGLCWLGLLRWMPESIGVRRNDGSIIAPRPMQIAAIGRVYGDLLRHKQFLSGCVALGLIGLPLMTWIALSPLLLMRNLGLSTLHYALWQFPIFGALIAGNITLNFIADKFKIERLLLISTLPVYFGLILSLILTPLFNNMVVLIVGLSVYAYGFGICNATLYRVTLFSSSHGLGAISAMLGMVSVGVFSIGGALLALAGAGNSLGSYIIAVAIPAGFAFLLIMNLLRHKERNNAAPGSDDF
ncbi:MFS transporter [Erwinia psidii]|uniref:MdfA family multidrug efflux MFS transporter n=1 Tax=Erwinia psidii TaxID=69224 RepID=A0A3N6SDS8_9GAMM|nr:MFS transporter [Erwinia psidii]MCX8959010.1 MFS transporter [Erwinia psidii]MCX8962790.1 MFS transporter [Erwinia psidii]MCX8966108.1 MFS transporter [Erwinia psidii]RQM36761.1 MdfA family multidrug efflux MFS transporter [Erwinia psidii]